MGKRLNPTPIPPCALSLLQTSPEACRPRAYRCSTCCTPSLCRPRPNPCAPLSCKNPPVETVLTPYAVHTQSCCDKTHRLKRFYQVATLIRPILVLLVAAKNPPVETVATLLTPICTRRRWLKCQGDKARWTGSLYRFIGVDARIRCVSTSPVHSPPVAHANK
jgi:hypothetical protein